MSTPSKNARNTQNSSSVIASIYNSRNNILLQLSQRGYGIEEYDGCSVNEVNSMYQTEQLDMLMSLNEPDENGNKTKIYIKYFLGKKLAVSIIQEMIDDLYVFEEHLKKEDTLLIIMKDEPNDTIVNYQKHIWEQDKIFLSIISIRRLQFNILAHEYVPPHRVMTIAETNQVKTKYNIMNNTQFPEISRFDPVALAIGIRPGQLCEIIRPSKTAVQAPYYRICV